MMDKVVVLLSTYNGEKYLEEQLNTIIEQKNVDVTILARDDHSSDSTQDILRKWQKTEKLSWYTGGNMGPALSFMDLIFNAPEADYYAFADQDDVWNQEKLITAIHMLSKNEEGYALYAGRTMMVTESLDLINLSKMPLKIDLSSSFLKSFASGCTMVFNRNLALKLQAFKFKELTDHDWWVCNLCLALGGELIFDQTPHIQYRQHGNNVIGGRTRILDIFKYRINKVKKDKTHTRQSMAKNILDNYSNEINRENIKLLESIAYYRDGLIKYFTLLFTPLFDCGIAVDNLFFKILVLLKRV